MGNHAIGFPSRSGAAGFLRLAVVGAALAASASGADARQPTVREQPALFSRLEKADAVVEGPTSPKRVLYVFFDANCWYCHLTWKALQHYEKAGLQVRWVPVAYQKVSSVGRAAAIMQAKDRVAAMRENELGYKPESQDGGIAPAKPREGLALQFRTNFKLMERLGVNATPGLAWKDDKGGVYVMEGMPRLSQLPAITGLPAQTITDPELKDFR